MLIPHLSDFVATVLQQRRTWRWRAARNLRIRFQFYPHLQLGSSLTLRGDTGGYKPLLRIAG
jgi:hypothetical protein